MAETDADFLARDWPSLSMTDESLMPRVRQTLDQLRCELLAERTDHGHWVGCLAPSALSTATAVSALSALSMHGSASRQADLQQLIGAGIAYLREQQNSDGGYGDTDRSHSNIATSYLVQAASKLAESAAGCGLDAAQADRLSSWIESAGAVDGLRRRYGKDKTFVVPILTNLAIAGQVDWDEVPALPFEAAVFPQSMYRWLRMPVVSYAIPALVAIGQARHFHGRRAASPLRAVRAASIGRTMRVLDAMQPESGGYLEATPLTAFVVMSLAVTGRGDCAVAQRGLEFLRASVSDRGSWPIDTNLATWVTSLSASALAGDPADDGQWCGESLVRWQLSCQHQRRHPFTGAEPGGWGWSDLSGAVPDSDDTPGAILALQQQRAWVKRRLRAEIDRATGRGIAWLLKLQNRDGGWPTFCRGWGKLPFDRSSTDLTAHAMRALTAARGTAAPAVSSSRIDRALGRGRAFLAATQRSDGAWLPLWFGNQDEPDEANPVYGTARVLLAVSAGLPKNRVRRGCDFLLTQQNPDGGWGGGGSVKPWMDSRENVATAEGLLSTVEETALAVEALSTSLPHLAGRPASSGPPGRFPAVSENFSRSPLATGNDADWAAIIRGTEFLLRSVADGRHRVPWPIGFYFAKLWYHEQLYPLIFTVAALGAYARLVDQQGRTIGRSEASGLRRCIPESHLPDWLGNQRPQQPDGRGGSRTESRPREQPERT